MFYADSHIHLQDYKTQDVKNIVTNAIKNNVCAFINVSSHPNDWNKVIELATLYPQIIPAIGVHPWYIAETPTDWLDNLEHLLQQHPQLMVGECGIDCIKNNNTDLQKQFFMEQIKLADKFNRPLIIHAVKTTEHFADIFALLPQRTVFHSFTGPIEWGNKIQKQGFFIGLNFSILRKKNADEIIRSLNLSHILLETDGPYQNNIPNTETLPQNLPQLAQYIADLRGINPQELQQILYNNWLTFIGENHYANHP